MKRFIVTCAIVLMASSLASAADVPGWDAFVIRNASSDNSAPAISDPAGGKLFQIVSGGQKAGWGTDSVNGKKIGDIESISITRHLPETTGVGPYMNFWVTDGFGGYAVLATGNLFATTWDGLKTRTSFVYEGNTAFKLPDGSTVGAPGKDLIWGYTFNDFAGYTIAPPPSHWGSPGAPDDLNASSYTAYGFNWVFGDTQTNYLGGYLVSDPTITAVPLPAAAWSGLVLLGGLVLRRRK
jgi:hypothetical protein